MHTNVTKQCAEKSRLSAKYLCLGIGPNISLEFEQFGACLIHSEISEIPDPVTEIEVRPVVVQGHADGQMTVAEEVEITLLFFVLFETILKKPFTSDWIMSCQSSGVVSEINCWGIS